MQKDGLVGPKIFKTPKMLSTRISSLQSLYTGTYICNGTNCVRKHNLTVVSLDICFITHTVVIYTEDWKLFSMNCRQQPNCWLIFSKRSQYETDSMYFITQISANGQLKHSPKFLTSNNTGLLWIKSHFQFPLLCLVEWNLNGYVAAPEMW